MVQKIFKLAMKRGSLYRIYAIPKFYFRGRNKDSN